MICLHTSLFLKANAQLHGEATLGGRANKLPLNQKTNGAVEPQVNFQITYFTKQLDLGEHPRTVK